MSKQGLFNWQDLTVTFGGSLSKPENIFTAKAIKVPEFKYKVKERESLGNGWYGGMEINEYTEDNLYVIIKDGKCIGTMMPYRCGNIKIHLNPIGRQTNKHVLKFLTYNNFL